MPTAVGKRNNARLIPLDLAQQDSRLYLVCRYEGYDNKRNLALHRIVSAETANMRFERPEDFERQKYDAAGRFCFGERK
ncbi:WYL domain-containing protein [Paraburkholderia sp.]|uniref:WYL domain-containing protein n=1 Tax=Paraburkholderia sp. TaxID=1926495 RepID=UPI003C7B6CE4